MSAYDCIVIGAGPAGSLAAYDLATGGARVLLVDRASFPRDKPCGGGVLLSAAKDLPFSIEPVVERAVHGFHVRYRRDSVFSHRFDKPLAYMTQRAKLDAFLAERAAEVGAEFQDGRRVGDLVASEGGMRVVFEGGDVATAPAAVAADGANGICRRVLGLPSQPMAVALEANVAGVPAQWSDSVGLELGTMRGGYGWVFPKGDHCNVGLGGWPMTGPTLRAELDVYSALEQFPPESLSGHRGHHLPLREAGSAVVDGRVAFVGDAAGLVDPLSGEGIGNAIRSGRLAASAVGRLLAGEVSDLSGYAAALEQTVEPELAVARQLRDLYHAKPWPYVQALKRSGLLWRSMCHIMRGESDYQSFRRRLGPLRPVFDLAARRAERSIAKQMQADPGASARLGVVRPVVKRATRG